MDDLLHVRGVHAQDRGQGRDGVGLVLDEGGLHVDALGVGVDGVGVVRAVQDLAAIGLQRAQAHDVGGGQPLKDHGRRPVEDKGPRLFRVVQNEGNVLRKGAQDRAVVEEGCLLRVALARVHGERAVFHGELRQLDGAEDVLVPLGEVHQRHGLLRPGREHRIAAAKVVGVEQRDEFVQKGARVLRGFARLLGGRGDGLQVDLARAGAAAGQQAQGKEKKEKFRCAVSFHAYPLKSSQNVGIWSIMTENALSVKKEFAGILFPGAVRRPGGAARKKVAKNPVFCGKTAFFARGNLTGNRKSLTIWPEGRTPATQIESEAMQ